MQAGLPLTEVNAFNGALRLYSTNRQVTEYNFDHMVRLGTLCD